MRFSQYYWFGLIVLLFVKCNINTVNEELNPLPLFPESKSVKASPKGGYLVNQITGDTIHPILLTSGDTLITGVLLKAIDITIDNETLDKPRVVKLKENLIFKNAHPNKHIITEDLIRVSINIDSIMKTELDLLPLSDNSHFTLNSTGDTLLTGVPLKISGKHVFCNQPLQTKALPFRYKDVATHNVQYLDVSQGMISSYVLSVLEDKKGNMWFGTYGGGVSRYNGVSFKHYSEKEGICNNVVRSLLEDKDGNLWFGTSGGVTKYDGNSFVNYTEKQGLSTNITQCLLEDKSGSIWIGTSDGVSKLNGTEITHYTKKEGLCGNDIRSLFEDTSGNIWIGSLHGGVSMFNGHSFINYSKKDGLGSNKVYGILEDKYKNIWFGTYGGGLTKFNGSEFTRYTTLNGLSDNFIRTICLDKSGNIWIGTRNGGVNKFIQEREEITQSDSFIQYTEREGLSNKNVYSILEDEDGGMWFGTYGGGVSKVNENSFTHFKGNSNLNYKVTLSILEDRNKNLWFGLYGGGVMRYNRESYTSISIKEGLIHKSVSAMLEDKNGNIWFGSNGGGVSKYTSGSTTNKDIGSLTEYSTKEGLSASNIKCILEDRNGNIWFGTMGGGVTKYDGSNFTYFTEKEGMSNDYVHCILEDREGNIWFGTEEGLTKYNGHEFFHYTEKEGLSNNNIRALFENDIGEIWVGTSGGGINVLSGSNFTYYTEKEGLSNNTVWSIMQDKKANIWVSTEKGISLFLAETASNTVKKTLITFAKEDGLIGLDFYTNSVCLDSENIAWWGSGKSLTMLDLNKFSVSTTPPNIFLTQIDINDQFLDFRKIKDSLSTDFKFKKVKSFENYPLNLELPYSKNQLTFHYNAIDWGAPHKIKYSYLLRGVDANWSSPSSETKADYRNLSSGTYTFKVRTIGESGLWSDPIEYTFIIHPPLWKTWWAKLLYVILVVLILVVLFKWRTKKMKQRQRELEAQIKNATLELRSQKEQVEITHKEITDSINYAERIQRSFLATEEILDKNLKEYFVFFKPKDVVSGDFYWADELSNGTFAMINADSTGHGVPGAIVSILNISSIEKAIESGLTRPSDIFNSTRKTIIERLKKDGSEHGGKDGMDASIICFDFKNMIMTYTAAQNPIWVVRNNEVIQLKPEKMPLGRHDTDHIPFTQQDFLLQKDDQIYTLTDGFQDQFGGLKGKKFMVKNLRQFVLKNSHLPMKDQHTKLKNVFTVWKGNLEQVDDVCVIGVKV